MDLRFCSEPWDSEEMDRQQCQIGPSSVRFLDCGSRCVGMCVAGGQPTYDPKHDWVHSCFGQVWKHSGDMQNCSMGQEIHTSVDSIAEGHQR